MNWKAGAPSGILCPQLPRHYLHTSQLLKKKSTLLETPFAAMRDGTLFDQSGAAGGVESAVSTLLVGQRNDLQRSIRYPAAAGSGRLWRNIFVTIRNASL